MKTFNRYLKRAKYIIRVRLRFLLTGSATKQKIIDRFHSLYYDSHILGKTWSHTTFLGTPIQKNPLDLFVYQEILYDVKPDLIIETGTAYGGGAIYLASLCDLMKRGHIVTIDIINVRRSPKHKRIKYLLGSSTDKKIVEQVKNISKGKKVLVILDSDHTKEHVLKELDVYRKLVSRGSYIIVEDSNVNGNPVYKEHGPGPMEAVKEFLKTHKGFRVDKSKEKFYFTFNPGGYLKKVR